MKINKDLKYSESEYTDFFFPSDDTGTDIKFHHSKLVKTRKNHACSYCGATIIWAQGIKYIVKGTQDKGARVAVQGHLPLSVKKIEKCIHTSGWMLV